MKLPLAIGAVLAALVAVEGAELSLHPATGTGTLALAGPGAGQQLVVLDSEGTDVTRRVEWRTDPPGIVAVDETGYVESRKNGTVTVVATRKGSGAAQVTLVVSDVQTPRPVSFPNDVVPVFTKNHCNAGGCHAKATGQNGFQLSLLGYEPLADYENIVNQSRGRRINPAAPEHSLVLMKASGDLPHGGGARLPRQSDGYRKILQWIESGLPYRPENDPDVERIEVFPREVVARPGSRQQLAVRAYFDDGSERDITRIVQYEANQPDRATPDENGLVSLSEKTGTTSVVVRFQEHIDTFTATIPLGGEPPSTPAPKNFIDEHIFERLTLMRIPPSGDATDSEFVRRVTLDIAGRVPTLEETRDFLASSDPEKRARKIDALLASTDYADFFAGKWAGILRNKVGRGREWKTRDSHAFHAWIRTSLIENKPYDQFAAELIQASGKVVDNPAVNWYRVVADEKERMENIAQVFLGVRMKCAQCHHHPYEPWSQEDYFSFAAFFSTIELKNIRKLPEEDILFHNRKEAALVHPGTREKLAPRLLGAAEPVSLPALEDPRSALASWIRDEDNPYLSRMLVNRYWKHFFSRGLVEPEDDIRPTNPATHPALLEELAHRFTASGYDLKELVRTICNGRTYQLSALPNGINSDDEQNYARYFPRRLPAEVLLDSINDITGARNSFTRQPSGVRAVALPNEKGTVESEFLMMFGRPAMDTACECERTGEANLGQSLHLLNSDVVQKKLTANDGRAASLAKDTSRTDEERVSELYLHALSRQPDPEEMTIALAHLEKKRAEAAESEELSPQQSEREAFEDLIWVLVNTKEFLFNR